MLYMKITCLELTTRILIFFCIHLNQHFRRVTVVPLVNSIQNFAQFRSNMPLNFTSYLSVWLYYTAERQSYTCYESCWPSVRNIFGLHFGMVSSYRTISAAERALFFSIIFIFFVINLGLVQTAESSSRARIAGSVPDDSSSILFLSIDDPNLEKYFAIKWLLGGSIIVGSGLIALLGSWYNYFQDEKQVDNNQSETIIKMNDKIEEELDEKKEGYKKSNENSNK